MTSTSSGTPSKLATRSASPVVGQKRTPSFGAQAWPNGVGGAAAAEAGSRASVKMARARRRDIGGTVLAGGDAGAGSLSRMDVLVAGGHGQIARHLLRQLAAAGHHPRGLIRNPDHAADLEADGAVPVLCDLEQDDPAPHLGTADAIVFAAGAGPGSGAERKRTVDYGGAVKLIEAAEALGVRRYLMVSSMGAGDPASASEEMRPYQQAKHDADEALAGSDLDWTIVRPGPADQRARQRRGRPGAAPRPLRRGHARGRRRGPARDARGREHRPRDLRAARRGRAGGGGSAVSVAEEEVALRDGSRVLDPAGAAR